MISRIGFAILFVMVTNALAEIENVPEWTKEVLDGSLVKLNCNGSDVMLEAGTNTEVKWASVEVGKTGEIITSSTEGFKLESLNGVEDAILVIEKVDASNSGTYLCIVNKKDEDQKVKLFGVNLFGPKYESLSEKYRVGIVTGAIAAAVCFVILVVPCVIYKCRYVSREDREMKKMRNSSYDFSSAETPSKMSYDNTAFSKESTKL